MNHSTRLRVPQHVAAATAPHHEPKERGAPRGQGCLFLFQEQHRFFLFRTHDVATEPKDTPTRLDGTPHPPHWLRTAIGCRARAWGICSFHYLVISPTGVGQRGKQAPAAWETLPHPWGRDHACFCAYGSDWGPWPYKEAVPPPSIRTFLPSKTSYRVVGLPSYQRPEIILPRRRGAGGSLVADDSLVACAIVDL